MSLVVPPMIPRSLQKKSYILVSFRSVSLFYLGLRFFCGGGGGDVFYLFYFNFFYLLFYLRFFVRFFFCGGLKVSHLTLIKI